MKNVLMVNTTYEGGGAAQVMTTLGHNLSKKDYKVTYLASQMIKIIRLALSALTANDQVWGIDLSNTPQFKNADIVHFHNLHGGYIKLRSIVDAEQSGKKVIWTLHDFWAINAKSPIEQETSMFSYPPMLLHSPAKLLGFKKRLYRKLKSTAIVVPSKYLLSKVKSSILSHLPITLIPNGIDTNIFKPGNKDTNRAKLGLPNDKIIILYVATDGSRNPYKGWSYIKMISQNYPQYLFVCVGESRSATRGNIKYVQYPGTKRLVDYYCAADCFIIPALHEVFGMTVTEAMSCGIPIVAFNTGAIPEIIKHKKNGYLARYQDARDLESGLNWVLSLSPKQLKVIKDNNRSRAVKLFSQQTMVDKYARLYATKII